MRRRKDRFQLRTNFCGRDHEDPWQFAIQLTDVEEAFKTITHGLPLCLTYHQLERRVDTHILVASMASYLPITLRTQRKSLVPTLISRLVPNCLAGIQMLDVHPPTSDSHTFPLIRYIEPNL